MAVWTRSEMKNYQGMITYLSLHRPLFSSSQALDTILADVSREVKGHIFHIRFYCFQNKISFSFNLLSFCKHYHTQGNNTSQNKHKNGKEGKKAGFLLLSGAFFYAVLNSSLFAL